jgi:transcription termination/antitermination protein NusG
MDTGDASTHWYAIRTRARHEKKVRDELATRRLDVFLPLYQRWSQWKDRRKQIEVPLFPGYCFARFAPSARVQVLNARGVADIVGVKGQPEPIPEREIVAIQQLLTSHLPCDPHPFLTEGMEVEVIRGPLAGVRGRLLRKDRATRLVLGVALIRLATAVEIHPADVVPV